MITVHADGDGRHRLEDASGRPVGWVRERAIGFGGMPSEEYALAAIVAAWPALTAALRRHYFGTPRHELVPERLRVVHDGAYEWVVDGQRPLARLHRPPADRDGGELAIEFVLPSYATEGVVVSVAQVLGAVLQPHLRGAVGAPPVEPLERSPASEAAAPA
jgi:hypothetical protein